MQKELEQTRMKFSLASQEITSLKAAAQQAQREKEQVMSSSSSALPSSFIYNSIIKRKRKWKKKKTTATTTYGLHPFKGVNVLQLVLNISWRQSPFKSHIISESYHVLVL